MTATFALLLVPVLLLSFTLLRERVARAEVIV